MDVQLISLRLRLAFSELATSLTDWSETPRSVKIFIACLAIFAVLANAALLRLMFLFSRPQPKNLSRRPKPPDHATHLLVILGSGGHTTEMLDMLLRLPLSPRLFTHRTYVVSSGDSFSAHKAVEFERQIADIASKVDDPGNSPAGKGFDVVAVTRARRVHQPIWTAPFSATLCFWDCLRVLFGKSKGQKAPAGKAHVPGYPDLILTNGPGTGFCVVFAAVILRFFGFGGPQRGRANGQKRWKDGGRMRTVFIESWARIKTLSLTGQMLSPFVDRLLVQWPGLVTPDGKAEYVGTLVV